MSNISNPGNTPEQHSDSEPAADEQPAGRPAQLPCPPWCTTDHAKTDRFERYVDPVMDLRTHSVDVARISNAAGNVSGEVIVDVAITDDLNKGTREGPLVSAFGAECMSPDAAMKVALAIVRAAMVATGAVAGEPR